MANSFKNITKFIIHSNYGGTLNLMGKGSFTHVLLYQSMLDHSIRASFRIGDTGFRNSNSREGVNLEEEDDLKITVGEKVELNMVDYYDNVLENILSIEEVQSSSMTTLNEMFDIHLCHDDFINNEVEDFYVVNRYEGKISETIRKILKDVLKTTQDIDIDTTFNTLPILGKGDKPLNFCTLLAPKSIPEKFPDLSGYFFFDTCIGYKFKSIDVLFSQDEKRNMIYNQTPTIPSGYTNKILSVGFTNNMNIINKIRVGTLTNTKLRTFDNFTNEYTTGLWNSNETYKISNNAALEKPKVASHLNVEEKSTKIVNHIYNTGVLPPGSNLQAQIPFAKDPTFNLEEIVRKSISRYNQAFLYKATITIHGDFGIYPGDIIKCTFPEISSKDLNKNKSKKKSGRYLVVDVSHMINAEHCYTKLNIIRDTTIEK